MENAFEFEELDNKKIIETKAKLDVLEHIAIVVDSLRESLTRHLVVSGIKDEEMLEKKMDKIGDILADGSDIIIV